MEEEYKTLYTEKEFHENFPPQYDIGLKNMDKYNIRENQNTKDGILYKNLYGKAESGDYRILKIEIDEYNGNKVLTPSDSVSRSDFQEFKRVVALIKKKKEKEKEEQREREEKEQEEKEEKEQREREEKEKQKKKEEKKKTRRRITRDKPVISQGGSKRKSVRNRKSKTKSKKARKSRKKKGTRTGR